MTRPIRFLLVVLFGAAALLGCPRAEAAPSVRFAPSGVMADVDDTFVLSFRVEGVGEMLSGYQLYLSFDPGVVELVAAEEGSLYTDSGLMTWFNTEELEPGRHYFFDTIFGEGTYIESPGELLRLTFRGAAHGQTQARVDTIKLADVDRCPMDVENVGHGDIFIVADTGVCDTSGAFGLGRPFPNPFTERVSIPLVGAGERGAVELEVYDAAGRLVRRLRPEDGEAVWDGRDAAGRLTAAAVYFVRARSNRGRAVARVVKVR